MYVSLTVCNSCPVEIFRLYTSKLHPDCNSFWQKPRSIKLHYNDPVWFEARIVGRDLFERFMKLSIAKNVQLDGDYTNHSIRSTVITTLDDAGFEGCHIIQLSSHKSEATIKNYSRKCPENKRKEMFESLSDAMIPQSKKQKVKPSATVSVPPDVKELKENLPNMNIEEIDDFDTIDDSVLADLMLDFPTENQNEAITSRNSKVQDTQNNTSVVPTTTPNQNQKHHFQEINTQFNTFNQQRMMPSLPQMYFPNSNVTINYNFKQ